MSLRFPFHGFSLINDHVKWRRFVGLGLPHCVWVLSASSFPHVMAVVRVIYGCQEVPASSLRPPKTRPTQRGGGSGDGGVSQPQNALMYLLGNKRIAEVDGPLSSRPEPRTNLFHLLFLLAEEEGGGALPPSPLGSWLLSQIASGTFGSVLLTALRFARSLH